MIGVGELNKILACNCAKHFKEEERKGVIKCFSSTCLLNENEQLAEKIKIQGCKIYKQDFVQEEIKTKKQ